MTGYIGGILDCDVEEQLEPDYRAPASTPAIKHREVETKHTHRAAAAADLTL